jgi:hypothetical protein
MSVYSARIEDGVVVDVIVGDSRWAAYRLGGVWLPSDTKVGIGWQVVDGQIVPPPAPEPEFTGDLL